MSMTRLWRLVSRWCAVPVSRSTKIRCLPPSRSYSSQRANPPEQPLNTILPSEPTWSLEDLFEKTPKEAEPQVSTKELHHLLRLSALPLPKDEAEEQRMQRELQSQLKFVKAIQNFEIGDDVKPLQSIRDETEEGMKEQEYTPETLKGELEKEEVVGKRGRIRRKMGAQPANRDQEKWDLLSLAPKKVGRYVLVDTAKD